MRQYNIYIAAAAAVFIVGCQSSRHEDTAKIMAELKEVNVRLDKVDAQLKELSKPPTSRRYSSNINMDLIDKIKLSDTATREEIKKYIHEIMAATKGQNCFSPDDPQVVMYTRVGEKNLDILLDAMEGNKLIPNYHLVMAINLMSPGNSSKELLIKALRKNPELVGIIIRNGWEADAKEAVKDIILQPPGKRGYLPPELMQMAASFGEPQVNEALRNHFINGTNRAITYQIISKNPGMKIDDATISQAWNNAVKASKYERMNMAKIAIGFGHKDALEVLLNRNPPDYFGTEFNLTCDNAIRAVVDCQGSIADIKKWYDANRDKIFFDPCDKKFKVR